MAIVAGQLTLSTTFAQLNTNQSDRSSDQASILLVPQASGTILLNSSATATGACRIPVTAGQGISLDLDYGERLYGGVASGTLAVDKLEQGT